MVALRRMWKMLHGLERELGIQLPFLWSVIPIKKGITAKSHRAWRPEEFYAMLDAVQGVPGFLITRDIAILMTLFHGAMRVSELTALNVSSIDPEQLAIDTITRKRRGRQVMRRIYVPRECMIAILTYLDIRQHFSGNDALFIDFRTGKRLCVRTIERVVKQFAIRANLNPAWFKPHGGRHGWGRRAGETEMYLPHIKSQLGHKSLAGSEVYINTTNTALKRGVHEKMETEVAWRHHINPVELEKKWPKKNVAAQIEKLLKVAPPKK
jgi:integrase